MTRHKLGVQKVELVSSAQILFFFFYRSHSVIQLPLNTEGAEELISTPPGRALGDPATAISILECTRLPKLRQRRVIPEGWIQLGWRQHSLFPHSDHHFLFPLTNFSVYYYHYYLVGEGCMWGSQRTTWGDWFSPSTRWVPGMELWLSRLGSKHFYLPSHLSESPHSAPPHIPVTHFLTMWNKRRARMKAICTL